MMGRRDGKHLMVPGLTCNVNVVRRNGVVAPSDSRMLWEAGRRDQ